MKYLKEYASHSQDFYSVEFCYEIGGHSDDGIKYRDFRSAMASAIRISREEIMYVGVNPFGDYTKYAVLYATPDYLKILNPDGDVYEKQFYNAVKKCIETGKTQIGEYTSQDTLF